MNSQTYVSDPTIWQRFYKNMSENKFNAYKYRKKEKNQTGRGMYGRYRGSYMIPVNQNTAFASTPTVKTSLVTPVAAGEQRAESQIQEDTKLGKPHVKLVKPIKRKKQSKRSNMKKVRKKTASNRSSATIKRKTQSVKFSSKNNRKKLTSRKAPSKRKEKLKPQKRKLDFQHSIWGPAAVKKRKN